MTDTGVIGGAAVPHAPQFFTLPPTEDHRQVARVERTMADIGEKLRALDPEVVVIVANDHIENFALRCVPAFTVHCGREVRGSFAGRDFSWPVASEVAESAVRDLMAQGFDPAYSLNASIGYEFGIPLTFCGFAASTPVVPIYVNSYLPPQPTADRCYAFGQALHRALDRAGVRAVMLASGGLSHFPGTSRYADPDVATDRELMAQIESGRIRSLLSLGDGGLDRTGNVEARSWIMLAGALGDRAPDVVAIEPSWHHTYAIAGFTATSPAREAPLHYPMPDARRLPLYEALYALRMEHEARQAWLDDAGAYADRYTLTPEERSALVALDEDSMRALDIHPLLGFLARLHVDLERPRDPS